MSRVCSICGKTSIMRRHRLMLRGRYNPSKKIRKYPNLQWLTLPNGKRIKACVKCIRNTNKKPSNKETAARAMPTGKQAKSK